LKIEFEQRVSQIILENMTGLGIQPFVDGIVETHLTVSGDGDFFRMHNDNGQPTGATRVLTFVYYLVQEPKRFTGGELRLFDLRVENGIWMAADTFRDIVPEPNMLVLFPSHILHEILEVHVPDRVFANSRFTLNGWLRRPA
jgi:Rps23 Pro-64 3,4-dihydroxylase Tpa1-like proline 4-hydroxylase